VLTAGLSIALGLVLTLPSAASDWRSAAEAPLEVVLHARLAEGAVGWRAPGARLERVGSSRGPRAVRVSPTRPGRRFSIRRETVFVTGAGWLYRAEARLRSRAAGGRLCLLLQELSAGRAVGSARTCVSPAQTWRLARLWYRSRGGGHRLVLSVYAGAGTRAPAAGFDVDRISISKRRLAPSEPASAARSYFATLPPKAPLPSGEECAARVRRSPWEPRPRNERANHTTPGGHRLTYISGVNYDGSPSRISSAAARALIARVDGNFTGTTDEIIQWGACKWGFDENLVRAVAVTESGWRQETVGDNGQSFGLFQIKTHVHPHTARWARESTAFNIDYALAWRRLMFEGHMSYWVPAEAVGNELACISMWFAGDWNWVDGRRRYLAIVRRHLEAKPWLDWGHPDR